MPCGKPTSWLLLVFLLPLHYLVSSQQDELDLYNENQPIHSPHLQTKLVINVSYDKNNTVPECLDIFKLLLNLKIASNGSEETITRNFSEVYNVPQAESNEVIVKSTAEICVLLDLIEATPEPEPPTPKEDPKVKRSDDGGADEEPAKEDMTKEVLSEQKMSNKTVIQHCKAVDKRQYCQQKDVTENETVSSNTFLLLNSENKTVANITVEFTTQCDENYYDDNCTIRCVPNEHGGNYTCVENGSKLCAPNWFTATSGCKKYCVEQNDEENGYYECKEDGEKNCLSFYYDIAKNCTTRCEPTELSTCNPEDGSLACIEHHFDLENGCKTRCNEAESGKNYTCDKETGKKLCAADLYGPNCDVYCVPIEHQYACDSLTGDKTCVEYYVGPNCECRNDSERYSCLPNGLKNCSNDYVGMECDCSPSDQDKFPHLTCDPVEGLRCDEDYYGDACQYYCPEGETYTCSKNGTRICAKNFYGRLCDNYCNPIGSTYSCNDTTGDKICKFNLYGANCDIFCNSTDERFRCDPKTASSTSSKASLLHRTLGNGDVLNKSKLIDFARNKLSQDRPPQPQPGIDLARRASAPPRHAATSSPSHTLPRDMPPRSSFDAGDMRIQTPPSPADFAWHSDGPEDVYDEIEHPPAPGQPPPEPPRPLKEKVTFAAEPQIIEEVYRCPRDDSGGSEDEEKGSEVESNEQVYWESADSPTVPNAQRYRNDDSNCSEDVIVLPAVTKHILADGSEPPYHEILKGKKPERKMSTERGIQTDATNAWLKKTNDKRWGSTHSVDADLKLNRTRVDPPQENDATCADMAQQTELQAFTFGSTGSVDRQKANYQQLTVSMQTEPPNESSSRKDSGPYQLPTEETPRHVHMSSISSTESSPPAV